MVESADYVGNKYFEAIVRDASKSLLHKIVMSPRLIPYKYMICYVPENIDISERKFVT